MFETAARGEFAVPLCCRCRPHLDSGEHACFGISPFNGHFTRERVAALAAWGRRQFRSMHFFVPDVPAAATLEALGYSPERAESKARRQANLVRNKIRAALRGVGVDDPDHSILDWAALTGNERFRDLLATATGLFVADEGFRAACLEATESGCYEAGFRRGRRRRGRSWTVRCVISSPSCRSSWTRRASLARKCRCSATTTGCRSWSVSTARS